MRIVRLNAVYEASADSPASLLARYPTMTGWARALGEAGARVSAVQRFGHESALVEDGVHYAFVADGGPVFPPPRFTSGTAIAAVASRSPDVIHVDGMMFPALVTALREACPDASIVIQDHAGFGPPGRLTRAADRVLGDVWRAGFDAADAFSFTAEEQADPWRAAGLIGRQSILSIVESSTMLEPQAREAARARTGVAGAPAIVWVGRLEPNKDPLTVLAGLELAFERLPAGRAWMLFQSGTLEPDVRRRVAQSPALAARVTLVGRVAHDAVASYLSAADLYVSGSHDEGSGYALIEATACGAVPVVTAIPSFRAIAADCGVFWTPGQTAACAAALTRASTLDLPRARERLADRFATALSWTAIGQRTLALYEELHGRRQAGVPG